MMQLMNFQQGNTINVPNTEFPQRSILIKKELGKGGEGEVFLAKLLNWNKDFDVALKISNSIQQTERQFIQKLIEIQNEQEQQEPQLITNIIRIYDIFEIQQYTIQVMEVGSMNLFKYMYENHDKLTNLQKFKICKQLLNAINFIHKLGLIHRDIKGENFILVNGEFKLIDFGLICSNNRIMTSKKGTRIFQAPELFEDEGHYTQSLDIWALGCVFYEIIKGNELFPCTMMAMSIQQIKEHKKNQKHVYSLIEGLKVCSEWKDLIKQMLHPNQFDRIKIQEAIQKVNNCIAQEENSGIQNEPKVNKQQQNNNQQNTYQVDFEYQLLQKQNEFNKALREKDQLIKTLQTKIDQKENDEKQYKDNIESLNKKVNKLEQEKKKYEEQIQQFQLYNQQVQNQMNNQITQLNNQQAQQVQQFNQQKQILDNEIKNQKIKIQQIEQQNLELQNKLNQTKDNENIQNIVVNTNKEMIFLNKIIVDLTNEIQNLIKQQENFKNIYQLLNQNNQQLNYQIQEIQQQIQEKQKILQNYEQIKLEIQDLDQKQLKEQPDILKTAVEIKIQQDKTQTQRVQNMQNSQAVQFTNQNQMYSSSLQKTPQIQQNQSPPFLPSYFSNQNQQIYNYQLQQNPPLGLGLLNPAPLPFLNNQNQQMQLNQSQQMQLNQSQQMQFNQSQQMQFNQSQY